MGSALLVVNDLDVIGDDHRAAHVDTGAFGGDVVLDLGVLVHHQGTALIDHHSTSVVRVVVLVQQGAGGELHCTTIVDGDQRSGGLYRGLGGLALGGVVVTIHRDTADGHLVVGHQQLAQVGIVVGIAHNRTGTVFQLVAAVVAVEGYVVELQAVPSEGVVGRHLVDHIHLVAGNEAATVEDGAQLLDGIVRVLARVGVAAVDAVQVELSALTAANHIHLCRKRLVVDLRIDRIALLVDSRLLLVVVEGDVVSQDAEGVGLREAVHGVIVQGEVDGELQTSARRTNHLCRGPRLGHRIGVVRSRIRIPA